MTHPNQERRQCPHGDLNGCTVCGAELKNMNQERKELVYYCQICKTYFPCNFPNHLEDFMAAHKKTDTPQEPNPMKDLVDNMTPEKLGEIGRKSNEKMLRSIATPPPQESGWEREVITAFQTMDLDKVLKVVSTIEAEAQQRGYNKGRRRCLEHHREDEMIAYQKELRADYDKDIAEARAEGMAEAVNAFSKAINSLTSKP